MSTTSSAAELYRLERMHGGRSGGEQACRFDEGCRGRLAHESVGFDGQFAGLRAREAMAVDLITDRERQTVEADGIRTHLR